MSSRCQRFDADGTWIVAQNLHTGEELWSVAASDQLPRFLVEPGDGDPGRSGLRQPRGQREHELRVSLRARSARTARSCGSPKRSSTLSVVENARPSRRTGDLIVGQSGLDPADRPHGRRTRCGRRRASVRTPAGCESGRVGQTASTAGNSSTARRSLHYARDGVIDAATGRAWLDTSPTLTRVRFRDPSRSASSRARRRRSTPRWPTTLRTTRFIALADSGSGSRGTLAWSRSATCPFALVRRRPGRHRLHVLDGPRGPPSRPADGNVLNTSLSVLPVLSGGGAFTRENGDRRAWSRVRDQQRLRQRALRLRSGLEAALGRGGHGRRLRRPRHLGRRHTRRDRVRDDRPRLPNDVFGRLALRASTLTRRGRPPRTATGFSSPARQSSSSPTGKTGRAPTPPLTGTSSNLAGPGSGAYVIEDASADYGLVGGRDFRQLLRRHRDLPEADRRRSRRPASDPLGRDVRRDAELGDDPLMDASRRRQLQRRSELESLLP